MSNLAAEAVTTHLDWYMQNGFLNVEGWVHPAVVDFVKLVDTAQRGWGVTGGAAEIGVHHGKLLLLLNSVCSEQEQSYGIDVFEQQELNIDHSGLGSRAIFESNLKNYDRHAGRNVSIIAGDSLTLDFHAAIKHPVRLFSIDGGHTVEHTISDLKKAQTRLVPNGVVILDDISSHHWLGVIEGVIEFLRARPSLVPVAIGYNKLILVNLSYADVYRNLFLKSGSATKFPVRFCGHDLVAFG
jgi:hypothetical protein